MFYRDYQLEYQDDMGTSGTKTYDLDFSDPITQIVLEFKATNGAAGNKENPIEVNISKIEIVDGGEVLWDMPGDMALGAICHLNNQSPENKISGGNSAGSTRVIPITFGRFLYDPLYAFNPQAHRNPQLKVTFDEATIRAAGGSGYLSDSFTLTILVRLMENAEAPGAFLSFKQVTKYTSLASGESRIDMPRDRVIRALFTRVYESEVWFGTNVTNFKLSADGGKITPFDLKPSEMVVLMAQVCEPLTMYQYTDADEGDTLESWVAEHRYSHIRCHTPGHIATMYSPYNGVVIVAIRLHDGTTATTKPVHFGVAGLGIHNTILTPFGRLNDPSHWFDPRQLSKLDYVLTNGDAGAEIEIAVQSVYQY